MAGGLFAVYRDPSASPSSTTDVHRSSRSLNNKSSSSASSSTTRRREPGLNVFRDNVEKENVDPVSGTFGKKALGNGKGGKKVGKTAFDGMGGVCASSSSKVNVKVNMLGSRTTTIEKPKPSSNGVCTGSLRTRVLPDLPPLESEVEDITPTSSKPLPPSTVEIRRSATPVSTLASNRCLDSPASIVDSGYAASSGKLSDGDLEGGLEGRISFDDESDMSMVSEVDTVDVSEANRRARALTESPLAEITQAFTGLGGFSNAPASPSPSQLVFNRPSPPLTRTRSSPSKSTSTLPPRMRPYSTNATTKKVKPGQNVASAPKSAPSSRSMRV